MKMLVAQSCPSLCDSLNSLVHGILQARILGWVAMPSSRDLPDPGVESRTTALQVDSLSSEPPEKPDRVYGGGNFL